MASSKYSRVLVHIRKTSQTAYEVAKFSECILDYFGFSGTGFVDCHLENNRLLLQPSTVQSSADVIANKEQNYKCNPPLYKIMHPPFCPVYHLDEEGIDSLTPEVSTRGVDVGVAILLESSDRQLLLTRRAPHMRTFPGVWVPPGGHVESDETLEEAALRELEEETGLTISAEERKSSCILGLWESVYPPILAMGHPKRHHVVVYMHITLSHCAKDLIPNFKLSPEEVDAAAWLSPDLVRIAVWDFDKEIEKEQYQIEDSEKEEIHVTLVNHVGEHVSGTLDANILRNRVPTPSVDVERISTGSRFALSLWLEKQTSTEDGRSHEELYVKYKHFEKPASSQDGKNRLPGLRNKI